MRQRSSYLYCIRCGRLTPDWAAVNERPVHLDITLWEKTQDIWCYGPFTYSTPPAYPENWHEIVQEPDREEMELINENAEFWLADYLNPVT